MGRAGEEQRGVYAVSLWDDAHSIDVFPVAPVSSRAIDELHN